jgi:serine/threonine-protein kinase
MVARDLAASSSSTARSTARAREREVGSAGGPLAARYRSLFVIGRGGMGTVEAALELHHGDPDDSRDPEPPRTTREGYERVVALKRLPPDAAGDKRRVEMFLREARLARVLDHPNVVRAYDYGEIDGELFLAMEYVEGQALSRVLKTLAEAGKELGPSLSAHILAEICEGLHAAHELRDEAGKELALVHRDVSPQNMMLGYDGQVRLLDFGVAKIEAESVTKTGEVKGKTAYMSPEQAMGDPIDRRSDLFGVGAVLFECLALRRMWGDGTDMDVIRKLALEQPPRLEAAAAGAPAALCALYIRLVARLASDRPATAHDVARELRALVPQDREEARRALRELLEENFGAQAAEQRARLTSALQEVAPDQADELRASVVPDAPATPPSRDAQAAVTPAREVQAAAVSPGAAPFPWLWLAAGAALVSLTAWRLIPSSHQATPTTTSTAASALSSAPAVTPPSALAPSSTPASTSASAPPSASALAPGPVSSSVRARASSHAAAPPSPTPSGPPLKPATTSPTATTKPPPDVDDHPF